MAKIISQLYRGNLDPIRVVGNSNIEMRRTENLITSNFNKLQEILDEENKEILEKYNEYIKKYVALISEQAFCDGFCLGRKISSEAISCAESML